MSIHTCTGNLLDVVCEIENGKMVLKGLKSGDGNLIPLPKPKGLVEVLTKVIKECEEYGTK